MRVGRISAMLMLAVVVLWAAVPAFACLMPSQQDDCCRQMMQATGSCDMDASQSCCQVHGSDSNVPFGRAAPAERPVTLMRSDAGLIVPLPFVRVTKSRHTVETALTIPRLGGSVLRI